MTVRYSEEVGPRWRLIAGAVIKYCTEGRQTMNRGRGVMEQKAAIGARQVT